MKARLQLAQWEERWQAKARAQKSRADHMTGKELALERTLELERQRDVLQALLTDAVRIRTPFEGSAEAPFSIRSEASSSAEAAGVTRSAYSLATET